MRTIKDYASFVGQKKILITIFVLIILCSVAFQNLPNRIYENMLDLKFGFNYSDVLYTVNSLGEEGRETYILASLILDTIFPILYVSFFLGIYSCLEIKRSVWYLLPVLVGISDILENIQISLIMMASVAEISNEQIFFASFSNQVKLILCSFSLIILLFGLIKKFGKTSII